MKLNENDARAVDMLLDGLPVGSAGTADRRDGTPTGAAGAAGATSAVNAMSDDLANRITKVDDMLRLLDYLPADEPPANLVQKTLRRIEESRGVAESHPAVGAGARPGATISQGLHRSPDAAGEED